MVRHIIKKPIEADGDCLRSMGQVPIGTGVQKQNKRNDGFELPSA